MKYLLGNTVALVLAVLIDMIISDPVWKYHPICIIGRLISRTEKMLRKTFKRENKEELFAGILLLVIVVVISTLIPAFILVVSWNISWIVYVFVAIIMNYFVLSAKCLKKESLKVYEAIKSGDIDNARYCVSMLVGRDTANLDMAGVTRAVVETIAENTSDGVTAPMFYVVIGGPAAGFFYKAVNTLDSMVGYKNDKYLYFGRASAKADDVLNFIPSRLTALYMIVAAFFMGYNYKNAWYIYLRDRNKSTSPNSGQTEAVCAGALGLKLLGDTYYFGKLYKKPAIGDAIKKIEACDIKRANRLMYGCDFIALFVALVYNLVVIIVMM